MLSWSVADEVTLMTTEEVQVVLGVLGLILHAVSILIGL